MKRKNAEIEEYVRKVEISNNELRQFAHVASHDLKEPLRMVTLYMQMLEKNAVKKLSDDELQYLHYAKKGLIVCMILLIVCFRFQRLIPK